VLAEVRSVKVSTLTPPEVAQDLTKPGRFLSPSFITHEAEECFHKAIAIVQRQPAKALELRATISLARLWQ
jgi:hypothetical protein